MGHEDEGDPGIPLDALELELHGLAQLEVQRGERLVQQQSGRPVDQGPGERNPLLLSAGELRRLAVGEGRHANGVEDVGDP